MNLEDALCRAFCDGITVSQLPAGSLSVSTGFEDAAGERIGFFLARDKESGLFRVEDDGALVPTLIASGVNVLKGTRARLFQTLLDQGRIEFDPDSGELRTPWIEEKEVPAAAMRFVALLIRTASLSATHPELVTATFREDAIARIKADLSGRFTIVEDAPLNGKMAEFDPDLLLLAANKMPVAVFIAASDPRIYEALLMKASTDLEKEEPVSVVALLDREGSKLTSKRMRQRAANRLLAAPYFYGEEAVAVERLAMEANRQIVH